MKLQTLALLSVLAFNCAYAQSDLNSVNAEPKKGFQEGIAEVVAASAPVAKDKSEGFQEGLAEVVGATAPINKSKSIDEIESQSVELKKEAKRKEEKAKDLEDKSQKLAKKSEKLEERSKNFDEKSNKVAEASKQNLEDSRKLADEVDNYEFKAQREEALHDICQKKIQKAKIFKIFDRRSEQQQIEKCIADYKESKLSKKEKIKQAYLGKQCTFNPGVSIECPEGTYKFESANPIAAVNAADRQDQKDPQVGEQQAQQDHSDDGDDAQVVQK
jgi:hypothetical protein